MPEIPKKKVPEEKRPVPRKEEEVPPPKGMSLHLSKNHLHNIMFQRQTILLLVLRFVCTVSVSLCFVLGFSEMNCEVLKVYNVFQVPAPPKKPVPEEKVPVPVPVTKKAPPPRGRVYLKPLTKIF